MTFIIVGADRESGKDVKLRVEATDESAARAKASRRGVLIASCTPDTSSPRPKRASVPSQSNETPAPPPTADVSLIETPNRLRPGEHDGFFDSTMLTLLRRQVQPEELLMVCDVQQPVSNIPRTMLLTTTRLMFLAVTNQHGQRMIAERREVKIEDIDHISVQVDRPKKAAHDFFLIEIVNCDGIEAWVSAHSSGRRIVEAVHRIKNGEPVVPFIRTDKDVAEAEQASLPEGVPAELQAVFPSWAEPFVLSNLKEIEDEQVLRKSYRSCLVIIWASLATVLLGFVGMTLRLRGWQMPILLALMVGPLILVLGAVNALYVRAKLKIASGEVPQPVPQVQRFMNRQPTIWDRHSFVARWVNRTTAPYVVVALICSMIAIFWIGSLLTSITSQPSRASTVSRQESAPDAQAKAKEAALRFANGWVASPASAVSQLDSRALDIVRDAVNRMPLHRFDGIVSEQGENVLTIYETGQQYPVYQFQITPVMPLGSQFMPVAVRVFVAKDSNKVISVVPQL